MRQFIFTASLFATLIAFAVAQHTINVANRGSLCPAITFQQSVVPGGAGTRFTFQSTDNTPLQRVDLHYGVNGAAKNSVNMRMKSVSSSQWEVVDTTLLLGPSDRLQYWFTYCTGPIDCDTEVFSFGGNQQQPQQQPPQPLIQQQQPRQQQFIPQQQFVAQPILAAAPSSTASSGTCPAIRFQQSAQPSAGQGMRFTFQSVDGTPLQRVDLHYGLNGGAKNSVNFRMRSVSSVQWETFDPSLNLGASDSLQYWFTYCTGPIDCDTEVFNFGGGQQALRTQPLVAQPLASGYGQQPIQQSQQQQQFVAQPILAAAPSSTASGGMCPAIRFQQSVQPSAGQGTRFIFQSSDGTLLQRVDLHYGLNGAAKNSVNIRMRSSSATQWEFVDQSLNLAPSDNLQYWFTYCTGPIDCDTEIFSFGGNQQQPQPLSIASPQPLSAGYGQQQQQPLTVAPLSGGGSCPAISFVHKVHSTPQGLKFTFQSTDGTPLKSVDLHFGVNDQPKNAMNVKMKSASPTHWRHHTDNSILLSGNDRLQYWFTYCTGATDCDTDVFTFSNGQVEAPQAILSATSYSAPVLQPIMAAPPTISSYSAPQALASCPAIQFTHREEMAGGAAQFLFQSQGPALAWVDVHYGVNGQAATAMNVRMKTNNEGKIWTHSDPALQNQNGLHVYYTYSVNGVDCDTEIFGAPAPQPILATPYATPAPAPIMAAPSYSAPVAPLRVQPIQVQSYSAPAPAPQPIMAAPSYSAPPQPIMAAPTYSAPAPAPQPILSAPSYNSAPQPLAAAPSYASYDPAPAPAPTATAFAAIPFGHGHIPFAPCPLTGQMLPFGGPLGGLGLGMGGFGGAFGGGVGVAAPIGVGAGFGDAGFGGGVPVVGAPIGNTGYGGSTTFAPTNALTAPQFDGNFGGNI
jgi:hypothetical protein